MPKGSNTDSSFLESCHIPTRGQAPLLSNPSCSCSQREHFLTRPLSFPSSNGFQIIRTAWGTGQEGGKMFSLNWHRNRCVFGVPTGKSVFYHWRECTSLKEFIPKRNPKLYTKISREGFSSQCSNNKEVKAHSSISDWQQEGRTIPHGEAELPLG